MKNFRTFLSESKNTHLTHLEDLMLDEGFRGLFTAIKFITSLVRMLSSSSKSKIKVTTKWDGCLHENTKILTNLGIMTIKEIYNKWSISTPIWVYGFDGETDCWVPILDKFGAKSQKSWCRIILENGSSVLLTEDHLVYTTNRGWVQSKDLTENDDLKTINIDGVSPFLELNMKEIENEK